MQTKFKIVETPEYLLVVSDEVRVNSITDWYYEHDNNIPLYQFIKETLPEEYYLPKVVAYLPKGNAAQLDLPLLPEMVIEPRGFDEFEYTEEDLRKAYNKGFSEGVIKGTCSMVYKHESFEEYIQFLKQSKTTPKWFVAEIEEQRTATYGGVIVRELKTTTNSEGKQVLVGTYLFE
jgi:polyphosphate kinase